MKHDEDIVWQLSREVENLRRRVQYLESCEELSKAAQEALLDAETRFRSLVQSPIFAIVTLDRDGRIAFWNQGAINIFGYSELEILGQPIATLIPELADNARYLQLLRHKEASARQTIARTIELNALRKTGVAFPIEMCVSSCQSEREGTFSLMIRDITYRKKALKTLELRTSEARRRTEELESLIETVAHDLKSPVMTIAGLARLLQKDTATDPRVPDKNHILQQIRSSADTLEVFLKDLLDGLSITHMRPEWISVEMDNTINQVVEQHLQVISEKGIRLHIEVDESVSSVGGTGVESCRCWTILWSMRSGTWGTALIRPYGSDAQTIRAMLLQAFPTMALGYLRNFTSESLIASFEVPLRRPRRAQVLDCT
ncbi:MAG: PAS domain S-box protein [Deltaproteobacteria bacterium]|nr:PAS domain S-box protein [Deltaproteobacteria bacterium]